MDGKVAAADPAFLAGGGEMGALMRAHDWSGSPLGRLEAWPQSLRSVVGLMLGSRYPMFLAWGPELAFLYNDGYAPILGQKHPRALSRPFREVWSEIWADIEPLVVKALTGEATFHEDLHLVMERNGYPEDTWYNFSYSPVRDEAGTIVGMFCACTETTGKVLAERRLATEHERQRHLFKQAPGFITILNGPEHVFEFVNEAYSRLFGRRDFIGKTVRESFPELSDQVFFELLDKVYTTGERFVAHRIPIRLQNTPGADPEERFLDFIYEPVKDEDGRVTGIFCEGYDVTEAYRAQEALRESDELNRRILASSTDCIKVLGLDGSLETMSEGGMRSLGYDAANPPPLGVSWPELFEPKGRAAAHTAMARAAAGETARFEASMGTLSGDVRCWDSVMTPILGADGRPEKVLGLSRDVTAQRAAEAALREGEARLSAIFAQAKVGLSEIALDGRFMLVNDELAQLLGRSREDLLPRSIAEITHPDDVAVSLANFRRTVETGVPVSFDKRYLRPDGTQVWANSSLTLLTDEHGRGRAVLAVTVDLTERHQVHEALRATTARAEALAAEQTAILSQLGEGVIVTDRAGRITFVNEAAARIHGVARLGVQPEAYSDAYHLLTLDGHPYPPERLPLARAVRDGETVLDARWRIRRVDGSEVLAIGSARPVLDQAGQQLGAVLTLRDDTEREAAERELRENEARLRALTDNLPSGMVYQIATGRDGSERRFLYVSQSHERLTGIPAEAVLADPSIPYNLILPEHRPGLVEAEARAIRAREPFEVQVQFRRADGEVRWCRIISAAREQHDGSLIWDGIQIDITDQKRAEAALRELNATLESRVAETAADLDRVWRNASDVFVVIDTDGVFRRINPAATAILGWSEAEMIGRPVFEFIEPADLPATLAALEHTRGSALPSFENRYRTKDGGLRTISWLAAPEGGLIYAYGRDVTAERARSAELATAQEALRQSQKLEAVGQLTGGVAHDFNNLLTIIKSSTDLLRRPGLPEERRDRYVEAISDTVDRASKLTGQLLAFARRQALKPEVFDVRERIQAISDMLRTIVGSRIELLEDVDCQPCFVEADMSQFETALVNMAVNARDAMEGEGTLTIVLRTLPRVPPLRGQTGRPGPHMELSITDTGTGIPAEQLTQIFEPFFTTKDVGKGTGLGLSQVYGFVKQSGGDVAVESEVGHGATFRLYLPLVEAPAPGALDRSGARSDRPSGQGQRILVVEDNADVGRFSTQLLQDLGYETTWAANAGEALELLRERAGGFDAVFSDVVMPGISGVELGHEVRRLYPGVPVLLTSGYSHVLAEEGPQGFELLHKPYAVQDLSRMLRRLLGS
jgi:PAS domain S-box-containing protein